MPWNVLIVDDERNMREGLKVLVDWEAMDCMVRGCFPNGSKALEYCRENLVDIILTDIQMPVMDGLELSRCIYEEYPDIIVIILSAYRNFEYAQTAIQYNVKRYLLKPIDENKLVLCVKKAAAELEGRNKGKDKSRERRRELAARLLFSYGSSEEAEKLYGCADKLGIELRDRTLTAARLCFPARFDSGIAAFEYVEDCLWNRCGGIAERDRDGSMALLFIAQEEMPLRRSKAPEEFLTGLNEACSVRFQWSFQAAVGMPVKDICSAARSYSSARNVFWMGCFQDGGEILNFEVLRTAAGSGKEGAFGYSGRRSGARDSAGNGKSVNNRAAWNPEEFLEDVRHGLAAEAISKLGELKNLLKEEHGSETALLGYADMILRGLSGCNTEIECGSAAARLRGMSHIHEIFAFLEVLTAETAKGCGAGTEDGTTGLVERIEVLLKEQAGDPELNIKKIAAVLGYNPAYMSRVFHTVRGLPLKEYISKKRMELACRLLKSTTDSIADIAVQVGYNDLGTFYEAFRKYKNQTPKEYRYGEGL